MALSGAGDQVGTAGIADNAVTTAKINDAAVTYAKIQDVSATDLILGRSTSGAGDVEEIACTAAGRAILDDANATAQLATLGAPAYTDWANYTPTVTLVGGANNTVPVYSTNYGRWCRIGNLVHVAVRLSGDGGNEGAGTGRINVALPVAASANGNSAEIAGGGYTQNTTNNWANYVSISASASTAQLAHSTSATAIAVTTGDDQNNASRTIRLHFWYEV